MKLDILLSCMHQTNTELIIKSSITGNVVVVNQCDREGEVCCANPRGSVVWIDSMERGLTRSRNRAISASDADVCMLCDDDEVFDSNYEEKILRAYEQLPQADIIIFKMENRPQSFPNKIMRLYFPLTMKVSSWQISFRREKLLEAGVRFDELLGAGTGNGGEEELKFLLDCEKADLAIYYVPVEIASVAQESSTWFDGFNETFFKNRGATTRYIMGAGLASLYAVYYIVRKRNLYSEAITPKQALKATFRGIRENKIGKQAICQRELGCTK